MQDKNNAALILKINLETMEVCVDNFLEDVDIDEVRWCEDERDEASVPGHPSSRLHLFYYCVLLLT